MQEDTVVQVHPHFKLLEAQLVRRLLSGEELQQLERWLFGFLLTLGVLILQEVLRAVLANAEFVVSAHRLAREIHPQMRSRGCEQVTVNSLFGAITVAATQWSIARSRAGRPRRKRGRGGSGLYPALWFLGVRGRATPAFQAEVARAMALCGSSREAAEMLQSRGIELSHKTASALAYDVGERALQARDETLAADAFRTDEPKLFDGQRILVELDGGRYKARLNNTAGRRTKKGRRGYKTAWKEPKGFVISILGDNGRPDSRFKALCDFTVGDADAIWALLLAYLRAYGVDRATAVVVIADGACWIWDRVAELRTVLGLGPEVEIHEVLDFYHAVEHLADIAEMMGWKQKQKAKWLAKQRRRLLKGEQSIVHADLQALALTLPPSQVDGYGRELRYFSGPNAARTQYANIRARGLPIGSGAIESAIRRVVNLRVKSNGSFWLPKHAELVMHMRAQLKTGRFDEMLDRATSCFT